MKAPKLHKAIKRNRSLLRPVLARLLAICIVIAGCRHSSAPGDDRPKSLASSSVKSSTDDKLDLFDPKLHPGATVIHPLDTSTLTESQIKFGVAPRRDPSVEYQPDIILMENGDKAIKSVASDGLTWTFDANAPQVSDFQEGKIVFATGRAVGRVLSLNHVGDSVKVILGPVQITDVIRNGSFEMDDKVDLSKMISYVAPDYPEPPDPDAPKTTAQLHSPPNHVNERLVLTRVSSTGKVQPLTMLRTFADGHRDSFYRTGRRWTPAASHPLGLAVHRGESRSGEARLVRTAGQALQVPGAAGVEGIQPLKIPQEPFDPPKLRGQLPQVALEGGQVIPLAGSDTSVGVEYDFDNKGLKIRGSGKLTLGNSGVGFFLDVKNGLKSCGIRLKGNIGIHLHLNASAAADFKANFHRKMMLPIDMTIPLGGPVPLSVTFSSSFILETAFSAKTSVLNAEGDYALGAGLEAGLWDHKWQFNFSKQVTTNTDLGNTVEGISVGINSVVMGFDLRALVGLGAFGFNAGVYVQFRFTGTVFKGPNIAFRCRQGTIEIYLDTGVGYSIPQWVTDAINFFLKPFTDKRVDPHGTFERGPPIQLYQHVTQDPEGCATPKSGGG